MTKEYLKEEIETLAKLKRSLKEAQDQRSTFMEADSDQTPTSAKEKALAYINGESIDDATGPTKEAERQLNRTIAMLQDAVTEQAEFIRNERTRIKHEEYPRHPEIVKARKLIADAMGQMKQALLLEHSARKDLSSKGLGDIPTIVVGELWNDMALLRNQWSLKQDVFTDLD